MWAEVTQRAYEESELNWTYLSFMTLATLLASIAIIVDSQILVIGAMVLGPEFVAIAALGLALVRRRGSLFGRRRPHPAPRVRGRHRAHHPGRAGRPRPGLGRRPTDVTGPRPGHRLHLLPGQVVLHRRVIAAAAGVLP